MNKDTLHIDSTDDAKELLRDAHDYDFAYSSITLDDVVDALRLLAESDDIHEFWGEALEVAAEHSAVTRALNVEVGEHPRNGRRAHVDVYHVSMGDGRIFQMGHVSYGPESEEQGWTDYPEEAAREDIARLCNNVVDAHTFRPVSGVVIDVLQNDLDLNVPRFQN